MKEKFTHTIEHEPIEGLLCQIGSNFCADGYAESAAIIAILLPSGDWHALPQPVPIHDESADQALEESYAETRADWDAEDAAERERERHDLDDWVNPYL